VQEVKGQGPGGGGRESGTLWRRHSWSGSGWCWGRLGEVVEEDEESLGPVELSAMVVGGWGQGGR
jgi:hypothetical protein